MTTKTMKCAYFPAPGKDLVYGEMPIPEPKENEVRIRVHGCGICHSDTWVRDGKIPGIPYPIIPGHEVVGVVDRVGASVTKFKVGERVGVGWFGGHCGNCKNCYKNEWISCEKGKCVGVTINGGYAEYMVAPFDAFAHAPDDLEFPGAAPLVCAGLTTFNGIRRQGILAGGLVAVQGVGGLGHLGIQFAHHMGYEVVAISRGKDKEELAKKLGAKHYIDSNTSDPAKELQKLGGADLIVTTAPSAKVIESLVPGLGLSGKFLLLGGVWETLHINPMDLLLGHRSLVGFQAGDSRDIQDTLKFSANFGVKPSIETFPLEKAQEAFTRMVENKARFRCVLIPGEGTLPSK